MAQMIRLWPVLLLALSPAVFAQQDFPRDITVTWLNADLYVDGTTIEAGDLEMVRIEIYRHNDIVPAFTATIPATGEGLSQSEIFAGAIPQPGTYRIEGYSIVVGGIESDTSVPAFKKYVGKPRSITNITVE
jgi:hypothetical protein